MFYNGLKLDIQKSSIVEEQNAFYNGWQHSHWVVNVLVFDLEGKVITCGLNAPGSGHNSNVCESFGVYEKLKEAFHAHGAKTAVDSAFSVSCLLYTSPSPRDMRRSRMPSSA